MRFARITFLVAGIWGFLVLTPLYFMFDMIGQKDPPPITHPAFYYGFISIGLTFQLVFLVIASNPVRFRPMILLSVLEKFGYGASLTLLYLQHRLHPQDLALGGIDALFGVLFLAAFFNTAA